MDFNRIFDVFSRRPEAAAEPVHDVPRTTRERVLLLCSSVFGNSSPQWMGDYIREFWNEIYCYLQMRHGRIDLLGKNSAGDFRDAIGFVAQCPGDEFLDFVEYLFRVNCLSRIAEDGNELVYRLNQLLQIDGLPYHVTNFVYETRQSCVPGYPFPGQTTHTLAFPKVIMRESEVIHTQAIAPALQLLQHPGFCNANSEFLGALEDYRRNDYGDCLTKCCSAFESFMKIVCDKQAWAYRQTDTAGPLIKIMLANTTLDSYFEPALIVVATLRNRLSTSHGAGTTAKIPSKHLARYAINSTASSMTLLADEIGLS